MTLSPLVDLVRTIRYAVPGTTDMGLQAAQARAVLEAGYRKRRTLTTLEEINDLPNGASIRSDVALEKVQGSWYMAMSRVPLTPRPDWLPATVLRDPREES